MSQFKKPKGLMNRSPSPANGQAGPSPSRVQGSHLSNQSQNYVSDLKRANEKNQNLLNSLLNDQIFEPAETQPTDQRQSRVRDANASSLNQSVPKIGELVDNPNPISNSLLPAQSQPDAQRKSGIGEPITDTPVANNYIRSDIGRGGPSSRKGDGQANPEPRRSGMQSPRTNAEIMLPALSNSFAKGISLKEQLAQMGRDKQPKVQLEQEQPTGEQPAEPDGARTEPQPPPPIPEPPNFYKSNIEPVLLVVSLKKIVKKLQQENVSLKIKSLECDTKESDFVARIRKLENTLEDLQLRYKLENKSTSDGTKLNLNDFVVRLRNIDQILDTATADNTQERFVEEIVAKNQNYDEKAEANAEALKALRDNLGRVKATLLSMSNL